MQVKLTKPELERFITEQVVTGRFESPDAAVEAAVEEMMLDEVRIDDATREAIERAEAQLDRGEGIEFDAFAGRIRARYRTA